MVVAVPVSSRKRVTIDDGSDGIRSIAPDMGSFAHRHLYGNDPPTTVLQDTTRQDLWKMSVPGEPPRLPCSSPADDSVVQKGNLDARAVIYRTMLCKSRIFLVWKRVNIQPQ